jgi:hypothetical protein
MAKKSSVNKSQAIRDALRDHPDKSPKEIADMLAAEGMKINAQYVSTIKSNAKIKSNRTVLRRKPTSAGAGGGSAMDAALAFIRASGGISQAQQTLQTLQEIAAAAN